MLLVNIPGCRRGIPDIKGCEFTTPTSCTGSEMHVGKELTGCCFGRMDITLIAAGVDIAERLLAIVSEVAKEIDIVFSSNEDDSKHFLPKSSDLVLYTMRLI